MLDKQAPSKYTPSMATTIHIPIPEDFRAVLGQRVPDEALLVRWSYEALVIEAYREGLITRGKIGELLGMAFHEREAWLKERGVTYDFSEDELDADRQTLDRFLDK